MYCNLKTEVKWENNATVAKFSDADSHIGRFRCFGVNGSTDRPYLCAMEQP